MVSDTMNRLFYMPSFYNALLAFAFLIPPVTSLMPPWFWDIIRANAILIAGIVALFYIEYGPSAVAGFYRRLFPDVADVVAAAPDSAWVALDIVVHFLPLVILGPPQFPVSLLASVGLFACWYAVIRHDIAWIYDGIPEEFIYHRLIQTLAVVGAWSALWWLAVSIFQSYLFTKK